MTVARGLGQSLEPAREHRFHAFGDSNRCDVIVPTVRSFPCEPMSDLGHEERIAFRLHMHRADELGRWHLAERILQEPAHRASAKASKRERVQTEARQLPQRSGQWVASVDLDVTIGADQEHLGPIQLTREKREQEQRRRVGPMQIVEHHHAGRLARGVPEVGADRIEEPKPCRLRIIVWSRRAIETHQRRKIGHAVLAELLSEHLDPRPERRRALLLVRAPPPDDEARPLRQRGQLFSGAGLADAGIPGEHHHRSRARRDVVEDTPEGGDFGIPAEKRHRLTRGSTLCESEDLSSSLPPQIYSGGFRA
jgi:hypothetical protein